MDQSRTRASAAALGALVYVGIAVIWVLGNQTARKFSVDHWVPIAIAAGAVALALGLSLVIGKSRKTLLRATAQSQVGFLVFGVLPAVLVLVGLVVFLPVTYHVGALRVVFLLVLTLFPAVMYYLFIASRKYSLLAEFLGNLEQLGLLGSGQGAERSDASIQRRLTYLRKFEAVYGELPSDVSDPIGQGDVRSALRRDRTREEQLRTLFTPETVVPVLLATVLIAVGWLLCLPPWLEFLPEGRELWLQALLPETTPVRFAFMGAIDRDRVTRHVGALGSLEDQQRMPPLAGRASSHKLRTRNLSRPTSCARGPRPAPRRLGRRA